MSVLVAENVTGLPLTTTPAVVLAPLVVKPEMDVGSVKLAVAVAVFVGPRPSVQFGAAELGTVAMPLEFVETVAVVTREVPVPPKLPPPVVIANSTDAPPSGVCPLVVLTSTDGAEATLDPAAAVCGCDGKPGAVCTTTAVSTPPNGLNDFVPPPMALAAAYAGVGAKALSASVPRCAAARPNSPLRRSCLRLGSGAMEVPPQSRNDASALGRISSPVPTLCARSTLAGGVSPLAV